jgi:hypothetical protein
MRPDDRTRPEADSFGLDPDAPSISPGTARIVTLLAGVVVGAIAVVLPAVRLGTSPFVDHEPTSVIGLPGAAIAIAIWVALLAAALTRGVRRAVGAGGAGAAMASPETRVTVAGLAVLFAVGIDWGLPGPSWALDEMGADAVLAGLFQGFANGWFDQYPPLHYYLLAIVYAPALLAERLGLFAAPWTSVKFLLLLHARQAGLVMAIGTVVLIGLLGDRMLGRRYGWLAAACAGLFLPFVFYAKTANLEAPYLFWTALAFVFLHDVRRRGTMRAWIGASVAAALAVTTKDQAYGSFALPFVYLAITQLRARRGWPPIAAGVAAGIATFALAHNLVFNAHGFRRHVETVVGPASQPFRMFDLSAAGQLGLAATSAELLLWMFGVVGVLVVAFGMTGLARRRGARVSLWLVLVPVSYYLTFVVPASYVYDRFLLPVTLACAPIAAVAIRRLLDGWPSPAVGRAAAVAVLAVLVWRAASVDAMALGDSRYRAEAWMAANIPAGSVVAASIPPSYLPRVKGDYQRLAPIAGATLEMGPDFIVVNTEFHRRHPVDSPERLWLRWLESGSGPYEEVFRYKAAPGWTAMRIGRRFRDRVEDPLTNLDKINPEIAIFQRRGG